MNFLTVFIQILLMTVVMYHPVTTAEGIQSEFSLRRNDNLTCGEKESYTAPTKLYCALKCLIANDQSCIRFIFTDASSQCDICFSCLPSANQTTQLASGALQYAVSGPNRSEDLTKGNYFFCNLCNA